MPREFRDRVKLSQIIESQLPQFIRDDVTTTQQRQSLISGSGTYTRTGKLVTITSPNHGLSETNRLKVTYISGSGVDGFYAIENVIDTNTFTIVDEISGKTSGTVNFEQYSTVVGLEPYTIQTISGGYGKFIEFLKQYYISQEYQGGPIDLIDNFDQYLRLDNLVPEVIIGKTTLSSSITSSSTTINVESTKGFPDSYGLIKIDDEIITYTSKTTNSFLECIRGFSGVTNYHDDLNPEELIFSSSDSSSHQENSDVENLSVLFLQEFYKKIKYSIVPGLEDTDFVSDLNVGNFLKEARSLYETKGTEESFKILFRVLFGVDPKVIDLERFLFKSSDAKYIRREVSVVEAIQGNPVNLRGQSIFKTGDTGTSASISEVQPFSRDGKQYYKVYLFVGYDSSSSSVIGNFNITPSTKSVDNVSITNSSEEVVTVDSTVGFPSFGYFIYDGKKVFYQDKTINQFLGCYSENSSPIVIQKTKNITTSETYYGFENGDTTKKVELRFTGVISGVKFIDEILDESDSFNYLEKDEIFVKNLGKIIKNPTSGKTYKEIFSNSLVYNTNCRFEIDFNSVSGNQFNVFSDIDKSNLSVGDSIEFLIRGSENIISGLESAIITNISNKTITIDESVAGLTTSNINFDIRRIQKKASSLSQYAPIKYGDQKVLSNVLNVYDDDYENDAIYIASNSLPSYELDPQIYAYEPSSVLQSSYNPETEKYSILEFDNIISFLTGDKIYYKFTDSAIEYLEEKEYYVEVLEDKQQIKLYSSRSLVGTEDYIEFDGTIPSGQHIFILYSQKDLEIYPQKLLKKFKINPDIGDQTRSETSPGSLGMMVDGVEILSYKTNDKIYYGPISQVKVLNKGEEYDVINPPLVELSYGSAKLQPVVKGSVKKVFVDLQTFDIDTNVSVAISGGNGSGAVFEPVIVPYQREIEFDARVLSENGGIDIDTETITFLNNHGLTDGQVIIYDKNGNDEIGIGTFQGQNLNTNLTLINNGTYYAKIFNSSTIQLYPTFSDYSAGINTIGITSIANRGIHKFKTQSTNRLKDILVLDGGSGYTNRKLIVKPVGISTIDYTVNFLNHGFNDGDLIEYGTIGIGTTAVPIVGLSTLKNYNILKVNNDSFRLCDAGIGGTDVSNYRSQNYVRFSTSGVGYQVFKYPDIVLSVTYSIPGIGATTTVGVINATPVVRGKIEDLYVYESGSNYGSTILNLKSTPKISVKNGSSAQFLPIISNGRIIDVQVQYGGVDYYSYPDIVVTGSGTGAVLRPVVVNKKIVDVVIIESGVGYSIDDTVILPVSAGRNAKFDIDIRSLTINNVYRFGKYIPLAQPNTFFRSPSDQIVSSLSSENLQYFILSYSDQLSQKYNDNGIDHSPIIGWAYDGNPIYGPYGYSNPDDVDSQIKRLLPGYTLTSVENRPSGFDSGFFIDDYEFTNSGDLDECNGRYCKTPEFPNGVYAYFASIEENQYQSGELIGKFPYFIGDFYRSKFDRKETLNLNQNFDFNSSNLIRNTLPYKVNDLYAGNDFIIESNTIQKQKIIVESIKPGSLTGFNIINSGTGYKVNDRILFENSVDPNFTEANIIAKVSEIGGQNISSITTAIDEYQNSILTWVDTDKIKVNISPSHIFEDNDRILISETSENLSKLSKEYKIGITTYVSYITRNLSNPATTGLTTFIGVTNIPTKVSIGSSLKIGNETMKVLDVYDNLNSIKVLRSNSGTSHTETSQIYFIPDSFTINESLEFFDSKPNDLVYFNPKNSVGVGSTSGTTYPLSYYINDILIQTSVPTQGIYIPNHPFKTNQKVVIGKPSGSSSLVAINSVGEASFNIPTFDTEEVYVINQSKDYIGIVTSVGLTTQTNGVFFLDNGSNNDSYYIRSTFDTETCKVRRYKVTINTEEPHSLSENDLISLSVKSSAGIDTSKVKLYYNTKNNLVLVEKYSVGVNTTTGTLSLPSPHNLSTGEKIYYISPDDPVNGLKEGIYYVYKVDDTLIKVSNSYIDAVSIPPKTVSILNSGATQFVSKVTPKIEVIKNKDLVFDLTDSSLLGFNLKIYYDPEFLKEFYSVSSENAFNVFRNDGTVGIPTANAELTLRYSDGLPENLYYSLEKDGEVVKSFDDTGLNNSLIQFRSSEYAGNYIVYNAYGIGSTVFNISLGKNPERTGYAKTECEILKYKTSSKTATGGIEKIRIFSSGNEYKKVPTFSSVESNSGIGAYVIPKSNTIGKPKDTRIVVNGFDYPSDKTLRPEASLPVLATISNSEQILSINVVNGGNKYLTSPDLVIINSETDEIIDNGVIRANLSGLTVGSVTIEVSPKGLPPTPVTIKTINNTNGISISQVQSSSTGIVTCILTTPIAGFSSDPFTIGEQIFVEGIQKNTQNGTGFNSADYNYQFFTVSNYYSGSNPGKLEFNIAGLTTNPGIAKTIQDSFASIIKSSDYPIFEAIQSPTRFFVGETIYSDSGLGFEQRDLIVKNSSDTFVRLFGTYDLSPGEIIRGSESFNLAKVDFIKKSFGRFDINAYSSENIGWSNDTGKISDSFQVLPDNDYYQNLSYTVKSTKTWDEIVSPVNSLLHTSGLKNFSDTEFITFTEVSPISGILTANNSYVIITNDIVSESRVDIINNFDLAVDIDTSI